MAVPLSCSILTLAFATPTPPNLKGVAPNLKGVAPNLKGVVVPTSSAALAVDRAWRVLGTEAVRPTDTPPSDDDVALATVAANEAWSACLQSSSASNPVAKLQQAQAVARDAYVASLDAAIAERSQELASAEARTLSEGARAAVADALQPADEAPGENDAKALLQRIKDAGVAGAVSCA